MNYRDKLIDKYANIIELAESEFQVRPVIEARSKIPLTTDIPTIDRNRWLRIDDVTCCMVDMIGSTELSVTKHERGTARIYQYFTGTLVSLFHEAEAEYIDVKGDGVFALFSKGAEPRALVAAINAKTFVENSFSPVVKKETGLDLGAHIGIDKSNVLVRTVGLKRVGGRSDRQNEVWAGQCVNVAAALAKQSRAKQLLASPRFYDSIRSRHARQSCGCTFENGIRRLGPPTDLWTKVELERPLSFPHAWSLTTTWCVIHGREYCREILKTAT